MKTQVSQFLVAAAALAAATASAAVKAVTDTTGYVVLDANDTGTQTSLATGLHFEGTTPVPTKDYLINGGRAARTPSTANANTTFGGRSLTLDEGGIIILKGTPTTITISDLRAYDSMIQHGQPNGSVTIKGAISVLGSETTPLVFQGSSNGTGNPRRTYVDSAITGAAGTRIEINHSTETDAAGSQFHLYMRGDNSGYAGDFRVVGAQNGVVLVAAGDKSLGASPSIRLANGSGRLYAGTSSTISVNGGSIVLENGGTVGTYAKSGGTVGLGIGGGTAISGTGWLEIRNDTLDGVHERRTQIGNVSISGIDGIRVFNAPLQLAKEYDQPSVPIDVVQATLLRTIGGCSAGPVTLRDGAFMMSASENVTVASVTFEQSPGAAKPYIVKALRSGFVTVTGDIVNNQPSGEKIRIAINNESSITAFASANSFRLLTAANLGKAGGPSADDFEIVPNSDIPDFVASAITGGTFSLEEDGGKTYLVYTLAKNVVYMSGADASGNAANGSSFNAKARWSDKALPHAYAAYFVTSGSVLRAPDGAAGKFPDTSLTLLDGSTFYAQGATVTVPDLRLMGGCILGVTRPANSVVAGAISVSSTVAAPANMQLEVQNGQASRVLTVAASISGTGAIRFRYNPSPAADHVAASTKTGIFYIDGDNSGFAGEWIPAHWCVKTVFKDAAAIGGASGLHFFSNGVVRAESSYTIPATVAVNVDGAGSDAASTATTNGGTFEVADGETLAVEGVVSGNGILRKTGAGTLRLAAANTTTGQTNVKEGTLLVDGSLVNGTAEAIVRSGAFIGGAGSVKTVELEDGAGLAVPAGQSSPLEIANLTLDGGIALAIDDPDALDGGRVAVAKVGAIVGTVPAKPSSATIGGKATSSISLALDGGTIYASRSPFVLIVR
ncbi:MAG: autotransporter-associated beta strand repeat-containing protein [Kiritimatiellae bacterium]|nr:autotransporter-associated beta strand repeat-containing protein [Kiritimatiellia bacterium]